MDKTFIVDYNEIIHIVMVKKPYKMISNDIYPFYMLNGKKHDYLTISIQDKLAETIRVFENLNNNILPVSVTEERSKQYPKYVRLEINKTRTYLIFEKRENYKFIKKQYKPVISFSIIIMSMFCSSSLHTQNDLLMKNLMEFYKDKDNIDKMISIINGESKISLRIVDWFVTNFAKKYYTVYDILTQEGGYKRFKVYNDYKLKLKAYSKRRLDPFCRWERITIPYEGDKYMETTIGQLNFFKWAIENQIIQYIKDNYDIIENDMNTRNSTSKNKSIEVSVDNSKTRKRREELSVSACKCIKKETVNIIVKFN